ncbi:MAG: tyrosine-type recombinase/integrase [Bacteroidales bacterium]
MANYTPFVKPNYISKDGTMPIYIRYNYDRTRRTLIAIGYSIKPEHWDEKKKWVKRICPRFDEIDAVLTKVISKIGNILTFAKDNDIDPVIEFVLLELEKDRNYEQRSNRVDVFETLEVYIEEKMPKVSADQIKDYRSLRKHLTAFKEFSSQPITFRNLNLKFYNEFMDYLSYKAVKPDGTVGLLANSAGKIIRLLKGFVNYQMAKGVIPHIDLKNFKVVEEETDAVYLTEKELEAIYKLDLSEDKELAEIRDIFIVGCYTGLRFSDLSTLNSEHIDPINGYINIKQRKVHKAVVIPMIDYVPEILEKYNYVLPKVASYKFNERLKELGKLAKLKQKVEIVRKKGVNRVTKVSEKWELMSSHTCRRSFCTNMYLSGFPAEELMKISGHKSPAAFMRYIKVDNKQAADRLKAMRSESSR